jgi:hypothetical protein
MPINTAIRPGRAVTRGRGLNQRDVVELLRAMRNRVLGHPGLVQGSTPANLANVAFDYMIDGQTYTKAAVAAGTVLTGQNLVNTAAGQFCKIRVQVGPPTTPTGTDGAITFSQGGIAGSQEEARIPPRTPSRCTIGLLDIPASFVFGTNTLATAGIIANGDPDLNVQALD